MEPGGCNRGVRMGEPQPDHKCREAGGRAGGEQAECPGRVSLEDGA